MNIRQRGVGKVGERESGISEQKARKLNMGREGKGEVREVWRWEGGMAEKEGGEKE